MKKNSLAAIGVIALSLVAITVILVSLLNVAPPPAPLPTMTETQTAPPTSTITPTPDHCATENLQATLLPFDQISREFSDTFVLAQNTPAAQLSPMISELQKIRRRAQDYFVPPCLSALKKYQINFMNTAIDVSLLLYSSFPGEPNDSLTQEQVDTIVAQVNQLMIELSDHGQQYAIEMARLLGVTVTPSPPTLEPRDTATP
jgi:hypothetical protein